MRKTAKHQLAHLIALSLSLAGSVASAQSSSSPDSPVPYAPPGYGPPAYPPPGYYHPQPAAVEETTPTGANAPFRRGFLAMPYVGSQIPFGDASKGMRTGMHLGCFLGGHVAPMFSLNGQVGLDILRTSSDVDSYAGVMLDLTFSPLLHLPLGNLEFVLGPKLGAFLFAESGKLAGISFRDNGYGYAYGLSLGLLGAVGRMAIGGLVGFTGRSLTHACGSVLDQETCTDDPTGPDFKMLSMVAAFLF